MNIIKNKLILILLVIILPIFAFAQEAGVRTPIPEADSAKKEIPSKSDEDEEKVYLNVQEQDIRDVIRQISKATGRNFIIDDKVRGKITIISERLMTQEEAYQTFLSALEVAGYTTVTGPGGIIKIVSTKNASKHPIPIHVDTTPYTDSFITRLISLENIDATEIQQILKTLISDSGNAFAYPKTNTLIITDSGANINRLMKLIKELDQEGPQEVLEVIHIKYADAKELAQTVINLFEIDKKTTTPTRTTTRRRTAASAEPELEGVAGVSKIIADERTNSLIVLASKRAIADVRRIISKMDQPMGQKGKIHVHYLNHANAAEIAQTLSTLTSASGNASKGKGGAQEAAVAQLEGGIAIAADEATNALIITASHKDYQTLKIQLINKLDIPRRQVYLESIIMELKLTKGFDYKLSGHGGSALGMFLPFGQTFGAVGNLFQGSGFFGAGGLLGGVLSSDQIDITVPTADGGSTILAIPAFSAFLNFLQSYTDANVISSPNILTLDNEESEINILEKIYVDKVTTTATGIVSTEPVPLEAGLTLSIKPQISEGDMVRLEINNELSNFDAPPTKDRPSPNTTSRKIKTTVMAMDGQTVVLGGLMTDAVTHRRDKIPILGDIPLLGWLFKSTSSLKRKTNLLVFITPFVIRDPSDFSKITKRKIDERNRFIDENYGKRQKKAIRKLIATHREDLLDYVPPPNVSVPGTSSYQQGPSNYGPKVSPEGDQPALTVTSPSDSTKSDIDLSY